MGVVGRTVGCTVIPYTGRSLAMVPHGRCRIICHLLRAVTSTRQAHSRSVTGFACHL
jgi:hypothetical protein